MVYQNEPESNLRGYDSALVSPASLREEILQDASLRDEAFTRGRATAPTTPIASLNQELDAGLPVGLTVLHGAPGVGKTAFALQCACDAGCPALYVTTELPPALLLLRITAGAVGRSWKELRRMPPQQLAPLLDRGIERAQWLLFADFTRFAPREENALWNRLDSYAQAIKAYRVGGQEHPAPYRLLVVDSVHTLVRMANVSATEYDALTAGLCALDAIAKRHNMPALGIAERSRGAMRTGGQSAAAGHRLFEYIAEVVIGLDRDEEQMHDGRVPILLSIHKNRWGEVREGERAIRLLFDPLTMRFTEEGK